MDRVESKLYQDYVALQTNFANLPWYYFENISDVL